MGAISGGNINKSAGGNMAFSANNQSYIARDGNVGLISKNTRVTSEKNNVKLEDNETKKVLNSTPPNLYVIKLEGPFDKKSNKVSTIEIEKWYNYKAKFNREPNESELKLLHWNVQYDDGVLIELKDVTQKGYKEITYMARTGTVAANVSIYAFFRQPDKSASSIADIAVKIIFYSRWTQKEVSRISHSAQNLKTEIYIVDERDKGYNFSNPFKSIKKPIRLIYEVGAGVTKPNIKKGLTGSTFRPNHPLKNIGSSAGAPVYNEDLLDVSAEYNALLHKWEPYFVSKRMEWGDTGPVLIAGGLYFNFNDDANFDLKSNKRSNLEKIACYGAAYIGEWTIWNGALCRYDDYGNFSYGYWGRIATAAEELMLKGADKNQEGKFDTIGDDPRDTIMVNKGFVSAYIFLKKLPTNSNYEWRWLQPYFQNDLIFK